MAAAPTVPSPQSIDAVWTSAVPGSLNEAVSAIRVPTWTGSGAPASGRTLGVVVRDHRSRGAVGAPAVPRPRLVSGPMSIEPVQECVPPGGVARVHPGLRDEHRDRGHEWRGRRLPAADRIAGVEVVDVP